MGLRCGGACTGVHAGQRSGDLDQPYTYDVADRVASQTLPSGQVLSFSYGAGGKLTEVRLNNQVLLTNMIYAPFGAVQSWVGGNAQTYARSYDTNGRLQSFSLGDGFRQVTWDAATRLTGVQEQATGATTGTAVFNAGYDRLDRLTSYITPGSTYGYGYDTAGNRTSLTVGGNAYTNTIAAANNRLSGTTGPAPARSYTYDTAGNPTGDGVRTYAWTPGGRLVSVTVGGVTTTYSYNGLAQRVSKSQSGQVIATYAYDEDGHLVGEYDGTGQVIAEHVWLEDLPVATLRPALGGGVSVYYVFADQINAPRAAAEANGQIVWRWDGEGFGIAAPQVSADSRGQFLTLNLRFPGQIYDAESALFYN
jgi:YD repeat-containing protein